MSLDLRLPWRADGDSVLNSEGTPMLTAGGPAIARAVAEGMNKHAPDVSAGAWRVVPHMHCFDIYEDARLVATFIEPRDARAVVEAMNARDGWRTIDSAPKDGTLLILANFTAMCLLTGAPHTWTARWFKEIGEWAECSIASEVDNGEPTHWMLLPAPPTDDAGGW